MKDQRRHIVLINKQFQFKLIAKFILVDLLIMIIFSIFMYIFLNSEIGSNLQSAHVAYKNFRVMLFPVILTLSVVNILISAIIIGIFVLYSSHKLAGPLYRFNAALSDISNKNLSTITSIREGDEFYECSNSLKLVSRLLVNDFTRMKEIIHQLKHEVRINNQNEQLVNRLDELEKIVKEYQV